LKALAHRELGESKEAFQEYKWVLVPVGELNRHERIAEERRLKNVALNAKEKQPVSSLDFYSHFRRLGLIYSYKPALCPDLRGYFVEEDGWKIDTLDEVVRALAKAPFFNRFTDT